MNFRHLPKWNSNRIISAGCKIRMWPTNCSEGDRRLLEWNIVRDQGCSSCESDEESLWNLLWPCTVFSKLTHKFKENMNSHIKTNTLHSMCFLIISSDTGISVLFPHRNEVISPFLLTIWKMNAHLIISRGTIIH